MHTHESLTKLFITIFPFVDYSLVSENTLAAKGASVRGGAIGLGGKIQTFSWLHLSAEFRLNGYTRVDGLSYVNLKGRELGCPGILFTAFHPFEL